MTHKCCQVIMPHYCNRLDSISFSSLVNDLINYSLRDGMVDTAINTDTDSDNYRTGVKVYLAIYALWTFNHRSMKAIRSDYNLSN